MVSDIKYNLKVMTTKPLLQAAWGQKPSRTPVWFLRQAGRYLPEYRAIRAAKTFLETCRDPKTASAVTLQPLQRFDLDAAIIFSDILIPCTVMGQELTFDTGHGPRLSNPVRDEESFKRISEVDISKLHYVADALAETKPHLKSHQTLIGFAGAPFTVGSYMIEGQGSKDFFAVKKLLYENPEIFLKFMEHLGVATFEYLKMQVEKGGAEVLMLFDTWVGSLPVREFSQFIKPTMKTLFAKLAQLKVPIIYYPGQGCDKLFELADLNINVAAVDWRTSLRHAHEILKTHGQKDVTLQGNLDPVVLTTSESATREKTRAVLTEMAGVPRQHIFNVGHGVTPQTKIENIIAAIDEIRLFRVN